MGLTNSSETIGVVVLIGGLVALGIARFTPPVRIVRELQGLSQNQLAQRTGIPQATLSAIENDRVRLGVERAKVLAKALKCHPAVLVFPGWEDHLQTAA